MTEPYKAKYEYQTYDIETKLGKRYYVTNNNLYLPSVTTIINSTSVIHKKNNINDKNHKALAIGDYLHKYLKNYIHKNKQLLILGNNEVLAKNLAQIVIENCINDFNEIWGSEVSVHYKNRYAGTIDLIGIINNNLTIVDYKSSYRKKSTLEMEEHFLQIAAYALAHDWQYKTNISSAMIFLCLRNGQFEKNILSSEKLKHFKNKWLDRLYIFEEQEIVDE